MALPLPSVIADVGPGGPLVTSMRGINALRNDILSNQIKGVEAQYAPLVTQANAAAKLAYANLMGPQFLAKLMGNSDVVANSPQLQDPSTMGRLYQAGMGAGTGNAMISGMSTPQQPPSMLGRIVDNVKNAFGFSAPQSNATQASNNAMGMPTNLSQPAPIANSMQPGVIPGTGSNTGMSYDQNGNNIKATPAEISSRANDAPITQNTNLTSNEDYFTKAGKASGRKEQEAELGKKRGDVIADLGAQQMDLSKSGVILDRLTGIIQNPEFQKMRSEIPYFQDKQLWYLSKNGTPEQQKIIGDLISTAQAFKASTVNSFNGRALEKEFNLADKIKIDENDTLGVAEGKLRSLRTLKDIAETKNDMIIDLMTNENMNQGEAVKKANKLINTKDIEKEVDSVLNPQPTEHDIQYMMEKRNLTRDQVIKSLKEKGYKNVP